MPEFDRKKCLWLYVKMLSWLIHECLCFMFPRVHLWHKSGWIKHFCNNSSESVIRVAIGFSKLNFVSSYVLSNDHNFKFLYVNLYPRKGIILMSKCSHLLITVYDSILVFSYEYFLLTQNSTLFTLLFEFIQKNSDTTSFNRLSLSLTTIDSSDVTEFNLVNKSHFRAKYHQ